ncbi:MAG: hypothetical protein HHJ14_10925 [Cellulomonas sp.]|nr:hypothetical protein [Cellulomonas sp.]
MGIGFATVARTWRRWCLQPWNAETFKIPTDPELEAKIRDVARTAWWTPLGDRLLAAMLVWQGAPYTGTSLNPVRSIAPAALAPELAHSRVYLVRPFSGGCLRGGRLRGSSGPADADGKTLRRPSEQQHSGCGAFDGRTTGARHHRVPTS